MRASFEVFFGRINTMDGVGSEGGRHFGSTVADALSSASFAVCFVALVLAILLIIQEKWLEMRCEGE